MKLKRKRKKKYTSILWYKLLSLISQPLQRSHHHCSYKLIAIIIWSLGVQLVFEHKCKCLSLHYFCGKIRGRRRKKLQFNVPNAKCLKVGSINVFSTLYFFFVFSCSFIGCLCISFMPILLSLSIYDVQEITAEKWWKKYCFSNQIGEVSVYLY